MSRRTAGVVALAGVLGWIGLIWLGVRMSATNPPTAGFDLELLLRAGRDVAAGRSPYDPAMLAGAAPVAERLFYSYPPIVAQVMSVVAAIPSPAMLIAWTVGAVAGLAWISRLLVARYAPGLPAAPTVGTIVALVPLMFPFAIGLLFGNLDVFFPLLYGLLLLGVASGAMSKTPGTSAVEATIGESARSGAAVAIAGLTKLHPASLGLWLVIRAPGSGPARRALAAAILTGVVVVAASLLVGGLQPWLDYAAVVRAGSGADLVDPRNAGPAAQIALLVGGRDPAEGLARVLQVPVTLLALAITAVAAWRSREPVESLAWAAAASLVVLPVTWYHYPSALIPFAIVAVLRTLGTGARGERVRAIVLAAAVVAAVAIAWLPLLYVAIGLVLVAIRESADRRSVREPAPG